MLLSSLYSEQKALSFEFFPPRKSENIENTLEIINELSLFKPSMMTVTYGAGGGTRALTARLVDHIHHQLHIPAVAHLTCVGHSKTEILEVLQEYDQKGIHRILALRGDPPKGKTTFSPHPEGFLCARDLVAFIKEKFPHFSVAVAGYPETHKEAESAAADINYLKEKVDAGAEIIITQLFFDSQHYYRFLDRAGKAGIEVPIVPGIMPVANVNQVRRFTDMCGATIPEALKKELSRLESDSEGVVQFGIEYARGQCEELLQNGAPGIHLYTLNKCIQCQTVSEALLSYFNLSAATERILP